MAEINTGYPVVVRVVAVDDLYAEGELVPTQVLCAVEFPRPRGVSIEELDATLSLALYDAGQALSAAGVAGPVTWIIEGKHVQAELGASGELTVITAFLEQHGDTLAAAVVGALAKAVAERLLGFRRPPPAPAFRLDLEAARHAAQQFLWTTCRPSRSRSSQPDELLAAAQDAAGNYEFTYRLARGGRRAAVFVTPDARVVRYHLLVDERAGVSEEEGREGNRDEP